MRDVPRVVSRPVVRSLESSLAAKLLPGVLSIAAGSLEVISFLRLFGLFAAHISGNLVLLASHFVTKRAAPLFHGFDQVGGRRTGEIRSRFPEAASSVAFYPAHERSGDLRLSGFGARSHLANTVFDGMIGIPAMAVQNALVQISLVGAPATAVMTTEITAIVMDVRALLFQRDPDGLARAGRRARHTWLAVVGFTVGCGLGAILDAAIGPCSLALPAGFGLLALRILIRSLGWTRVAFASLSFELHLRTHEG